MFQQQFPPSGPLTGHSSVRSPTPNEGIIYRASSVIHAHYLSPYDYPSNAATESTDAYNTAYAFTPRSNVSTPTPTTFWSKEYEPGELRAIKEEDMIADDLDDLNDETDPIAQEKCSPPSSDLKDRLITQLAHLDLSSKRFVLLEEHPIAGGGFADIWSAVIGRKQVAIKTVRMARAFDAAAQERAVKELHVWSKLQHSHVLQLVGFLVGSRLSPGIALVSKFYPNGSAATYVVGKEPVVVLKVILGACLGLRYLHSKHVVHGDFRGDNLLISKEGETVVADFGLSKVLTSAYNSSTEAGNPHWTAPEIFLDDARHTKMSDVWSCGMTILELFSGKMPYHNLITVAVPMAHKRSELPQCPVNDNFGLLNVCSPCWKIPPSERANMNFVTRKVQSIVQEMHLCRDTLEAEYGLADTYFDQGQFQEAEELDKRVLEGRLRLLGSEHPDTLLTMVNLAATHRKLGRLQEAEEMEQQVLKARQRSLGADHPDTLLAMTNLALTYHELGQFREAEEMEQQVLERRQRLLGVEHPTTLAAVGNLAATYRGLGRFRDAEELEQRVLEARQRLLGAEHPDTLFAMANLASTYHKLGRFREAEEMGQQVLEARQRLLGAEHLDTLSAMANLAVTRRKIGRLQEAEEMGQRVLEVRQRLLGAEHPDMLSAMVSLAVTHRKLGRLQEAEEMEQQVLEARQSLLGAEHLDTLFAMSNLAATCYKLGRLQEAEEMEQQVLEARQRLLGAEHLDTLFAMANLAVTHRKIGRLQEAEEMEQRVLEARQRLLGAEHPDTLLAMANLAVTSRKLGRLQEAEEMEQRVLEARQRSLGAGHSDTLLAMANLAST